MSLPVTWERLQGNAPTISQGTQHRVYRYNHGYVMQTFLERCAQHDFRQSIAGVDGAEAAQNLTSDVCERLRDRKAFITSSELRAELSVHGAPEEGVEWMVDYLVVRQVATALRDLVACKHDVFDCDSVPEGILWRKNASVHWSHQCLPDRFGWFSDSISVRDLLHTLLITKTAVGFARTMGFTSTEDQPNSGYGPMYFMFFTERQLNGLHGVSCFHPTWSPPTMPNELSALFAKRAALGLDEFAKSIPDIWIVEPDAWQEAIHSFTQIVGALEGEADRVRFLDFSISVCNPLWEAKHQARSLDPRWHPVAACRHLLDQWFGANHLFMGDGFTWSEDRRKGHAEWLVSSFENFDLERVSIFPD